MRCSTAIALILALAPSLAFAQGAIRQSGPSTQFDVLGFIQDHQAEAASKMFTDNARGFNPFHIYDAGGAGLCSENALTTGAYTQVCLGHNTITGNGLLSIDSYGGAAQRNLDLRINGTYYTLPQAAGLSRLLSAGNYYLNPAGSDANDCLAAVAVGNHGPCLTPQHALAVALASDANQGDIIINMSAGTHVYGALISGYTTGGASNNFNGFVYFKGAGIGSTFWTVTNSGNLPLPSGALIVSDHAQVTASGLTISCTATATCSDVFVQSFGYFNVSTNFAFGTATAEQLHVEGLGMTEFQTAYQIAGGGTSFASVLSGGFIEFDPVSIVGTCTGAANWNYANGFFRATQGAGIYISPNQSWSGCGSITGLRAVIFDGGWASADGNNAIGGQIPGNSGIALSNAGIYSPAPSGTGTRYSVTNQRWLTGAFTSPIIDQAGDATQYNILSFNGNATTTTMIGWMGGGPADSSMYGEIPAGGAYTFKINGVTQATLDTTGLNLLTHPLTAGNSTLTGFLLLSASTVAALPTCNAGAKGEAYLATDLNAPTFNGTAAGGGAVTRPVYCDGTNWKS